MTEILPFFERFVLITGASRGIGYATALAFARAGAEVVAVSRSEKALETLAGTAVGTGGKIVPLMLDMTDVPGIERLADILQERYGRLDVLVGNAGVLGSRAPVDQLAPGLWEQTLAVNLTANWHLIRVMHPLLKQSDAGRALFITSGLSWRKQPLSGAYAASKAGLNALVEAYAAENENSQLRVNLFSPGATRTDLYVDAFPQNDVAALSSPEDVAEKIVEACLPTVTYNGKVFDFRGTQWSTLGFPQPA